MGPPKSVIILGAGITGLSFAWFLQKKYPTISITLVEQSDRVGGWIQTTKNDNFLFEYGPRSCRTADNGVYTLELIEELGLQDEVVFAGESAKKRYLLENNRLQILPSNLSSFIASPYRNMIVKGIWKDLWGEKENGNDESVWDFFRRRMGQELADSLIDPLTIGIYAKDSRSLSMASCFPEWYRLTQAKGSFIRGVFSKKTSNNPSSTWIQHTQRQSVITFRQGMETLINALLQRLHANTLFNTTATSCDFSTECVNISLSNGDTLSADYLFSTLPTYALAPLINVSIPEIPYTTVTLVHLGFNKKVLKQEGFGYLVPSKEQCKILGMVWDSSAFPSQNSHPTETRLTLMIQGDPPDSERNALIQKSLTEHLGCHDQPDVLSVVRRASAIPQYLVGHRDAIQNLKQNLQKRYPRLILGGTAFDGVSINDCIAATSRLCQI